MSDTDDKTQGSRLQRWFLERPLLSVPPINLWTLDLLLRRPSRSDSKDNEDELTSSHAHSR